MHDIVLNLAPTFGNSRKSGHLAGGEPLSRGWESVRGSGPGGTQRRVYSSTRSVQSDAFRSGLGIVNLIPDRHRPASRGCGVEERGRCSWK